MAVVGARERDARTLAVRTYAGGEVGALPLDEVVRRAVAANATRSATF